MRSGRKYLCPRVTRLRDRKKQRYSRTAKQRRRTAWTVLGRRRSCKTDLLGRMGFGSSGPQVVVLHHVKVREAPPDTVRYVPGAVHVARRASPAGRFVRTSLLSGGNAEVRFRSEPKVLRRRGNPRDPMSKRKGPWGGSRPCIPRGVGEGKTTTHQASCLVVQASQARIWDSPRARIQIRHKEGRCASTAERHCNMDIME